MEAGIWIEYLWVFVVLVGLEGLLAADNAMVMALIVKHLPDKKQQRALLYGLGGAFVFRFISLFLISFLVHVWQVQAIGAAYLLFISIKFLVKKYIIKPEDQKDTESKYQSSSGFWMTVLKVELTDIAFAVDSILAAVALATTLPNTPVPNLGGMDGAQFGVIFAGGMVGLILMRIAASYFVKLLQQKKGLETSAYIIVGWVGVKLVVHTLAHPELEIIPKHFPESILWKIIFWSVMVIVALAGWFLSPATKNTKDQPEQAPPS